MHYLANILYNMLYLKLNYRETDFYRFKFKIKVIYETKTMLLQCEYYNKETTW